MANQPLQQQARPRQIGLMDLLAVTAFVVPAFATVATVKRTAGGPIQYLLAVPLAIVLGTLIACVEWKLGKVRCLRFKNYSEKVKNAVGFGLYVIQLFWILVGAVGGERLGAFIMNHIPG